MPSYVPAVARVYLTLSLPWRSSNEPLLAQCQFSPLPQRGGDGEKATPGKKAARDNCVSETLFIACQRQTGLFRPFAGKALFRPILSSTSATATPGTLVLAQTGPIFSPCAWSTAGSLLCAHFLDSGYYGRVLPSSR
ncbi:hypothetical protein MRX96_007407 [Rhipicephalus microplus]